MIRTSAERLPLSTGITVEYVAQGPDTGVPVILLHGLSDSWRSYEPLLPHLPSSIRAYAISLRGHGDSDRPTASYTMRDMASDVVAFMDATRIDMATIVGHSMGARVAMRLAVDHPTRVRRLMLLGAFAPGLPNPALDELQTIVDGLTESAVPAFAREFQESTITRPVASGFVDTMVGESLKLAPATWRAVLGGFLADDVSAQLATARMPALLVWGERDAFVPRRDQDALCADVPRRTPRGVRGNRACAALGRSGPRGRNLLAFVGRPSLTA